MDEPFDSYLALREGVLRVAQQAQRSLDIFDNNGDELGLGKSELIDVIKELLQQPNSRIRIVVHDPLYLERDCPRFFALLQFHGHQISVHSTLPEAQVAKDSIVISDGCNMLRRYHTDYARGVVTIGDIAEVSPWQARFEAIWGASQTAVTFSQLGL